MSYVKFFGSSVLCVIGHNFDVLELKKSISKKADEGIVLTITGAMLNRAETDLAGPAAARRRSHIIDQQSDWMSLRELSRMRNT